MSRPAGRVGIAAPCGGVAALTAAALAGDVLSPLLLDRSPLALVALTPRTPYLVAAADRAPLAAFVVVAVVRLCAADPLHFALGRAAGPAVLARLRRARLARRLPGRLPAPTSPLWLAAVAASPTAKTLVVAGALGLPVRGVAAADVAGTVVRVLAVWGAGHAVPGMGTAVVALAPYAAVPSALAVLALAAVRLCRSGPADGRPSLRPSLRRITGGNRGDLPQERWVPAGGG